MKKKSFLNLVFRYSAIFCTFFIFIIFLFYRQNKGLVWINVSYDGLDQHLVNLHLLKNFLSNLFSGHFVTFIWNIGYGMDMFANYNYYIFGDFLSYLAYLFPHEKLDALYYALVIARVYLTGLTFLFYVRHKKMSDFASLMGVTIYLFSFYIFFSMARHPYFLNVMIIFPILLISIERMILENKKAFFTFMIALMFLMSFYFGYMLSFVLAIYGIILAFQNYDKKKAFKVLLKTFLCAFVGLLISMVTLLPTIDAFLSSGRSGTSVYFYTIQYYINLIGTLIRTKNTGYWSIIGISSVVLIILPIFFQHREKYKVWYWFLLVLLVPLVIPFAGTVIDCMSFPNNRWIFVYLFIISYICTIILNEKYEINFKRMGTYLSLYAILLLVLYGFDLQWFIAIILSYSFLGVMYNRKKIKRYQGIMFALLALNVFFNILYTFDSSFDNYVKEYADFDANSLYSDNNHQIKYFSEAINYIKEKDDGFYNVMVYPNVLSNLSIMNDYNSTSYFYSLVSNKYYTLAHDLENTDLSINSEIKHLNYRPFINNLLNNRYLITTNSNYVPYGYHLIKSYDNDTYVFENTLKNSFSHLYTYSIKKEDYDKLSPIDKEISLLVNYVGNSYSKDISHQKRNISYNANQILDDHQITLEDNKTLTLSFDSEINGELYLYIPNIKKKTESIFESKGFGINVKMNDLAFHESFETKYFHAYYYDNNDLLINLGYYDTLNSSVDIIFSQNGTYTFDDVMLVSVDMQELSNIMDEMYVEEENYTFGDNRLSFDINVLNDGVLSFTTNYHKNWKVYVDNNLVESKSVNDIFLGCDITSGNHHIELVYENPTIIKGLCLSIIGLGCFIGIIIYERKKERL